MKSLFHFFIKQVLRESILYCRQPRLIVNALLFFVMIIVFFPLFLPPNPWLLKEIAPGIIWIAWLLATLLASEQLFQQEFDAGVLEQYLLSSPSLSLFISAKLLVHWFLMLIPILLLCPLFALLFHFSMKADLLLMATLTLGSPCLLCLSALATAFGLSLDQKGTFMGLILFILALPVMILGTTAFQAMQESLPVMGYLAILTALSLLAVSFLPITIATVIRIKLAD